MKGKSNEEEEIKILKCNRNIHFETVNEKTKESSSEEEEHNQTSFCDYLSLDVVEQVTRNEELCH